MKVISIKGCVRTFYVNENGFEVTISFGIEDWWVSDIASFHDQKPSKFFIETLEETEMLVLTPTSKAKLLMDLPKFELFFRLLVQRNLSVLQNRLINTIATKGTRALFGFLKALSEYPLTRTSILYCFIPWSFS
ncbi:Crp/Fnr family transcriptional regulator [Sphingobacterium daejeonense]|uniref:Crp/Fnr family transcriptional regulator n=1 Tax=Sphingobacterium daejeonense TaxID=371142 RepID=UPI0018D90F1F|nr:Crp/Fnr family transcriptional regulator [Sphingobacterium daejeonense]